jgi:hypothetical protein
VDAAWPRTEAKQTTETATGTVTASEIEIANLSEDVCFLERPRGEAILVELVIEGNSCASTAASRVILLATVLNPLEIRIIWIPVERERMAAAIRGLIVVRLDAMIIAETLVETMEDGIMVGSGRMDGIILRGPTMVATPLIGRIIGTLATILESTLRATIRATMAVVAETILATTGSTARPSAPWTRMATRALRPLADAALRVENMPEKSTAAQGGRGRREIGTGNAAAMRRVDVLMVEAEAEIDLSPMAPTANAIATMVATGGTIVAMAAVAPLDLSHRSMSRSPSRCHELSYIYLSWR